MMAFSRRAVRPMRLATLIVVLAPAMLAGTSPAQEATPTPTSQPGNIRRSAAERMKEDLDFVRETLNKALNDDAPLRFREDLDKCVQICRSIRRERPDIVTATLWMAESLRLLGRGNEAVDLYSEVLHGPAVEYHYVAYKGLGKIYADSGWHQLALSMLEKAAALKTGDKDVYRDMARCYEAKDDLQAALDNARYAVGADPEDPQLHALQSRLHAEMGDFVAAAGSAQRAMRLAYDKFEKDPTDVITITHLLYFSRFRMDIIQQYIDFKVNNPSYGEDTVLLALMRIEIWRQAALLSQLLSLHEALKWVEDMNKAHPDDPRLLVEIARIQYQLQMAEDAKTTLDRVFELSPGNEAARQLQQNMERREGGMQIPRGESAGPAPQQPAAEPPPAEPPTDVSAATD